MSDVRAVWLVRSDTSLAALAARPEGRAALGQLAAAVQETFSPVSSAARQRCGVVANWLAGIF